MRQKRNRKRWHRATIALGTILCLWIGVIGIPRMDVAKWLDRSQRQQAWVMHTVENAIGFLSPVLGYEWDRSEDMWEQDEIEQQWQRELEVMLLAEQGIEGKDEMITADGALLLPEDEAEMAGDRMEWDDDLLAEIDRENELMRQQAELLQNQQSSQAGVGSQMGQQMTQNSQITQRLPVLPYSMDQLSSLEFLTEKLYYVNKSTSVTEELLNAETLLAMDMRLQETGGEGAKVLIHHTHATEYFADSHEKDEATLIVGVGDYLERLLEDRYGIEVIHDRTVYPYNEAYSQALEHVEQILAENPTIEVFIDLHRDAGGTKKYTVNVEGKETANLMFFNGLSHSAGGPIEYLPNENQQANLAFSFQMKMVGDSLYPGLCKRNYLKAYRYNLHVLPRAVIVEVGDNNNTLQEAKNAMEPLARILNYILIGES